MIVTSEVLIDIPGIPRQLYYRCTDDLGGVHDYGPVFTNDQTFNADAYASEVAVRVAEQLAEAEFNQIVGI